MPQLVPPQKDATLFLIEGHIGEVMLRFMQAKCGDKTTWMVGENGKTPDVYDDIMEAKAQWHFLIDLYVMKLMVDAERKVLEQ